MTAPDKILYSAKATASGAGRDGRTRTDDGVLDLSLSVPKGLGGGGGPGTNPEQLFASGYSACFLGALRAVAGKAKFDAPADTSVTATVGIGPGGGGYLLAVTLDVALPGADEQQARQIVDKAHQVCPYSNATRDNVDVKLNVTV